MCKNVNGGECPEDEGLRINEADWWALNEINLNNIDQLALSIEPIRLDLDDGMDKPSIIEDISMVNQVMELEALDYLVGSNFPIEEIYLRPLGIPGFFEKLFVLAHGCTERETLRNVIKELEDSSRIKDLLLEMSEIDDYEFGYTGVILLFIWSNMVLLAINFHKEFWLLFLDSL